MHQSELPTVPTAQRRRAAPCVAAAIAALQCFYSGPNLNPTVAAAVAAPNLNSKAGTSLNASTRSNSGVVLHPSDDDRLARQEP